MQMEGLLSAGLEEVDDVKEFNWVIKRRSPILTEGVLDGCDVWGELAQLVRTKLRNRHAMAKRLKSHPAKVSLGTTVGVQPPASRELNYATSDLVASREGQPL